MKNILFSFLLCLSFIAVRAQTYQWTATNSPYCSYRFEDVFFLNADTGFAVHYNDLPFGGEPGYIMKTVDGGSTWIKTLDSSECYFRDVGFTDPMHGWVGTIDQHHTGADTAVLYQTIDGGLTWNPVNNFPGPDTAGICGLQVINDSTIYGIGRYFGPAGFYKTTDNGLSWSYTNLSSLAAGLVDLYFVNADTGFATGTSGPSYTNGYGRILYTTDAGTTWSIAYTSAYISSLGWKIVFPSRMTGYSSLEFFNFPNTEYFMKTTDGGITWQDIAYVGGPSNGYNVEGMGFLNDTIGWVGGGAGVFFTQNGGASWIPEQWGNTMNRFRFLNDSVAYSAGEKIYRMTVSPTGIGVPGNRSALQTYPSPATGWTCFEFYLDRPQRVKLSVSDMSGQEVERVFDKPFEMGNQHFTWQPKELAAGTYVCTLEYGGNLLKKKLEIIK